MVSVLFPVAGTSLTGVILRRFPPVQLPVYRVFSVCLEILKVILKICLRILVLRLPLRVLYRPPEGMPVHEAEKLFDLAMRGVKLNTEPAYHRILKAGRTIADIAG